MKNEPAPGADQETARLCLACGYNLFGLGDEPRCPECGLLNIPKGYREQVWALVDSGCWFFSSALGPFRKRPPGWWWALDREGDLKRSFGAAARNLAIASLITVISCMIADAFPTRYTTRYAVHDRNNPTGRPIYEATDAFLVHFALSQWIVEEEADWNKVCWAKDRIVKERRSARIIFAPSWHGLSVAAACLGWLLLLWIFPAMVGIWTQIRKGLPEYAHPPRTIMAAANYETHRLVYVSVLISACLGIELVARQYAHPLYEPGIYFLAAACSALGVGAFGAAGWIGPLRSDYTRQLVRSRLHAIRIVVMYAILLPWAFTLGVVGLIGILTDQ